MNGTVLKLIEKKVGTTGFVKLIDVSPRFIPNDSIHLKCDYAIVQAARVSYSSGTKQLKNDKSLIYYLYRNAHTSPFEMVEFKFHIKAPLFIVRQWQRHRMSSYNEISGRYSVLNESFWKPVSFREQSILNKQSSESNINENLNKKLLQDYDDHLKKSYSLYNNLLSNGVTREMARSVLPVSINTEFYWKIDLHNLLRFISLRSDYHAQQEIREYSDAIMEIIKEYCPVTTEAFEEYSKGGIKFNRQEVLFIQKKTNSLGSSMSSKSAMNELLLKIKTLTS